MTYTLRPLDIPPELAPSVTERTAVVLTGSPTVIGVITHHIVHGLGEWWMAWPQDRPAIDKVFKSEDEAAKELAWRCRP